MTQKSLDEGMLPLVLGGIIPLRSDHFPGWPRITTRKVNALDISGSMRMAT